MAQSRWTDSLDPKRTSSVASPFASSSASPSPPPSAARIPFREGRGSFCSVKEDESGIPQSFSDSKSSTFSAQYALDDSPVDPDKMATTVSLQQPPSFCCPCGGFKGWKQVGLGGRYHHKSKSYGDLRLLGGDAQQGWDWTRETSPERVAVQKPKEPYPPGQSPIEKLPVEILDQIIPYLAVDLPPNGYSPRNADLVSCLLTSRTLHAATLSTLYNQITIPHSFIFSKFLQHVSDHPALGTVVRRLDFSHFTSVGLGRSRRDNEEIQMVTSRTLLKCLELTPHLREFVAQEAIDDDMDAKVLDQLFCKMPQLQAIDFCAASSHNFRHAFSTVINPSNTSLPLMLAVKRLSLHECNMLPPSAFETLLPRLPKLTHLDVARTQITNSALFSIPKTARLSHLNLSKCSHLSGEQVVEFITHHPAVSDHLVYLNLLTDPSRSRLLDSADVDNLLPRLPASLRSLNLSGAKISGRHVPLLLPLTKHLEELSLGFADISIQDINSLFIPKPPKGTDGDISIEEQTWVPSTLHYLDITGVASVTLGALFSNNCVLTKSITQPLEVIELGDRVINQLKDRGVSGKRLGWVVREIGRRGWYVREPRKDILLADQDRGKRPWKMGARWWGMRKVPVVWGEVGGIYGHYMFKI